jgi:glycosyltransferase involved in cell wall biosynthesis
MPTYRQPARLRLALANVAVACSREAAAAEVIVVDDWGDPEVGEVVGALAARWPALSLQWLPSGRGGRSAARNRGAAKSRGSRLLFLDGDMLVAEGTIGAHAALEGGVARGTILRLPWVTAFSDPATGELTELAARTLKVGPDGGAPGLSSRIVRFDQHGYPAAEVRRWARANRFERDIQQWFSVHPARGRWLGVTGAHLSVSRDAFLSVGGFDEAMGRRWGAEDLELGYRFEKAGIPIRHLDVVAYHMDHDTSGREGDHAHALGYFAEKHGNRAVLRLLDYFEGACPFQEIVLS